MVCVSGYYHDGTRCRPCYGGCEECDGSYTNDCTSCSSEYPYLRDGFCESCPEGEYFDDGTCVACSGSCVPQADRDALLNFYYATEGDSWESNTNWLVGDPCTNNWYGLECNPDGTIQKVYLPFNFLTGYIPSDFAISTLEEM